MSDTQPDDPGTTARDWFAAIFLTEAAALLIALATVFLPGRRGANWSPATLLFDDPGRGAMVASNFVVVNLIIVVLGVIGWLYMRTRRPTDPR